MRFTIYVADARTRSRGRSVLERQCADDALGNRRRPSGLEVPDGESAYRGRTGIAGPVVDGLESRLTVINHRCILPVDNDPPNPLKAAH